MDSVPVYIVVNEEEEKNRISKNSVSLKYL